MLALQEGTLVLNNIHLLPKELLPAIADLIKTNQYTPVMRPGGETPEAQTSQVRIISISEQTVPAIDSVVDNIIKVPPLRVRKADLDEQINYYLNLIGRDKNLRRNKITPEAIRNLQSYDLPNNLRELESIIERALTQLEGCDEITEEVVWQSQSKKKQYRLNLLNKYPKLRYFLRSDWFPYRINYGLVFSFLHFSSHSSIYRPPKPPGKLCPQFVLGVVVASNLNWLSFCRQTLVRGLSLYDLWRDYPETIFNLISQTAKKMAQRSCRTMGRLVSVRFICLNFALGRTLGLRKHCLPFRLLIATNYRRGDDFLRNF